MFPRPPSRAGRQSAAAFRRLPAAAAVLALAAIGALFPPVGGTARADDGPTAAAPDSRQRQERLQKRLANVVLVGRFTIDRPIPPPRAEIASPPPRAEGAEAADRPVAGGSAEGPGGRPHRDELALHEEEYAISAAMPLGGDLWLITARIRYGDKDLTVPVPVAVKWAGETPVITLDSIAIPGLGTFSSRVVLDGDRYAGTWQHDAVGGHMFGRIERGTGRPER